MTKEVVFLKKKIFVVVVISLILFLPTSVSLAAEYNPTIKKVSLQSVESVDDQFIQIKWSKVPNADGYQIYRSTSKDGAFKKIATVKPSQRTYNDKNIKVGKRYYYKIRAYVKSNGNKYGKFSSKKSAKVIDYCSNIPDYWFGLHTDAAGITYEKYLNNKIEIINSLHKKYGEDCFSFIQITDVHYPSNLGKLSPLIARKIVNETPVENVIFTGDWNTRGCYDSKEELIAENELVWKMMFPVK